MEKVRTEKLVYQGPSGQFEGIVAFPAGAGKRPGGGLVAPTWMGRSRFEVDRAVALAELGYVGLAIDVYGAGRCAGSQDEAAALMQAVDGDRAALQGRMNAALDRLKTLAEMDTTRTAGIGFCFGGKCVLDLARSGAEVGGVVSFHGVYDPPPGELCGKILSRVLVLHGWDDPLSPPDSVAALGNELTAAGAAWELHVCGHTGHAFTNPAASMREQGLYYQAEADRRAWLAARGFLAELFGC